MASKIDGKWGFTEYLDLNAAPSTVNLDNKGNFIITTSNGLVRVDRNKKIDTLYQNEIFFGYLYPNSSLVLDNLLYVGMRSGVLKFELDTRKKTWMTR